MLKELKKQQTMKEILSKKTNQRNLKINPQMDSESISEFISDKLIYLSFIIKTVITNLFIISLYKIHKTE